MAPSFHWICLVHPISSAQASLGLCPELSLTLKKAKEDWLMAEEVDISHGA